MQRPVLVHDLVIAQAVLFLVKADADLGISNSEVLERDFQKPFREVGINDEDIQRSVRIQTEHGLKQREHCRGRPCLRPIGFGIERGKRMLSVSRMSTEDLGQSVIIEDRGSLKK